MELDGETDDRKVCTIVMSNRKYGGGGMLVAPHADLWMNSLTSQS